VTLRVLRGLWFFLIPIELTDYLIGQSLYLHARMLYAENVMTLLDAQQYDPSRDRRRRIRVISIVVLFAVIGGLTWYYHNWPEERIADQFFQALQDKDYNAAYGIWMHDLDWKQHAAKYTQYPFNDFYRDWGPGGEWGLIKSHRIYGSATPKGGGSGVVVEMIVNERAEHARVWVERSDKTISFSPI